MTYNISMQGFNKPQNMTHEKTEILMPQSIKA